MESKKTFEKFFNLKEFLQMLVKENFQIQKIWKKLLEPKTKKKFAKLF